MIAPWRRPLWREWFWLLGVLCVLTLAAATFTVLWRTDLMIYDAAMPSAAAPKDIIIVAVDDASIAQLGRWPWRRAVHAAMLDRLQAMGAKAIVLDILLTEPDPYDPLDDEALAAAIARAPPVALPMLARMPTNPHDSVVEELPIPALATVARVIGHANIELDKDGMVRSVYLREGLGHPDHWQLSAALLSIAPGEAPPQAVGLHNADVLSGVAGRNAEGQLTWVRDAEYLIPFSGPPGHIDQVSFVDVLKGNVPADVMRGKLVLVGATATGLGDEWPTPVSGFSRAMPGVEINANILQALRNHALIRRVPTLWTALLSMVPLLLAALGLMRLTPGFAMAGVGAVWLLTLAASFVAVRVGWWWPPSAALAALLVLYPAWSWRRLAATQHYLDEELGYVAGERFMMLGATSETPTVVQGDPVERRIQLARRATTVARNSRRLFGDAIDSMPDGIVIADTSGRIAMANLSAARMLGARAVEPLLGTTLDENLSHALVPETAGTTLGFADLVDGQREALAARSLDGSRHYLLRSARLHSDHGVWLGIIVDFSDISAVHAAQRERDDVIRFLSHDMKSPASSLLGLAQLQRDPARALAPAVLSDRLDLLATRLIALVDGFVALARAESVGRDRFVSLDMRDVVQDACDEVWAAAQAREVKIDSRVPAEPVMVVGERSMLARALINLLANAVKFSPVQEVVTIVCSAEPAVNPRQVVVRVIDQGPGIDPDARARLFQRFQRRAHRGTDDPGGAGLGLAFAKAVADKHHGRVWSETGDSRGAVFCLAIPLASDPDTHPPTA